MKRQGPFAAQSFSRNPEAKLPRKHNTHPKLGHREIALHAKTEGEAKQAVRMGRDFPNSRRIKAAAKTRIAQLRAKAKKN